MSHTECQGTAYTSRDGTDDFGRKTFDEVQTGIGFITRQFTYHDGRVTDEHKNNEKIMSGPVTNLVKRIVMSDGRILSYEYDKEERIRKVSESDKSAPDTVVSETVYTYDSLGQLIKEIRDGVVINEMTYDKYGNIKTRNGIAYTYGNSVWKDQLTGYGDKSISYDSQGNPVSYLGHTLTWEKGRQLKKYDSNTYTYNANGIRTGKTVSGVKHSYRLEGTKILSEKWGNNTLTPLYDNNDEVCGIVFNGASYYFLKNLQGDVISILDSGRNRVAEYLYDAWGVCTVVNDETEEGIAEVNPFRYRSYYYDDETGMYYLQSRYYDPAVGRFINADTPEIGLIASNTLGHNIFSYCVNNPCNLKDSNGHIAVVDDLFILILIGLFASLALILGWMTIPEIKESWSNYCTSLGNGLADIGNAVIDGGKAAWRYSRTQVKLATTAVKEFTVIAKADAKIRTVVRRDSKQRYWTATLKSDHVDLGRPISYGIAVKEVSRGNNVFTVTRAEAKAVAKAAYSHKKPMKYENHGQGMLGYYPHYHVYNHNKSGHVFFLMF